MDFRTIVPLPPDAPVITPATHALVLGSCFAEHVGERLQMALGPEQCCVNPFGVLYNPMSIAQALEIILDGLDNLETQAPRSNLPIFLGRDGLWHSWLHSTHYSAPTREECIARCRTALDEARRILDRADLLIITFGTSRCYLLNPSTEPNTDSADEPSDHFVVANCHKELATRFTERDCTIDEIVATWRPLLAKLQRLRPTLQVIFTVSPYRYHKYGYHASQLAKARLLLAVEELTNNTASPQSEGMRGAFPAYEIVLDELRDYRFYKPDMLHPSEQAVDYIWERFREWAFTPEMEALYHQRLKTHKALNHYANH
ncbi:MAG: GSCFA domain-containing protein [Bacteroidales bacterium]|nr:GSCFA domain-containing protein [Bacteroidales bacterium]